MRLPTFIETFLSRTQVITCDASTISEKRNLLRLSSALVLAVSVLLCVAVGLLSPLHILSMTEPMTKPAMAPSTLCVWANPLKSPIHLINPIVVLILPAIISVSHVLSKQITRNRPFPVLLGPVSAPVFPCFVAGCSLADAPRLRIHCPADGASLDIDKPQTG